MEIWFGLLGINAECRRVGRYGIGTGHITANCVFFLHWRPNILC